MLKNILGFDTVDYYQKNSSKILEDYFTFLKFKSISSEPTYQEDCSKCCSWLAEYLKDAGFQVEVIPSSRHANILATYQCPEPNRTTLLLYGHYDVQPVDPLALWESPPFEPRVHEGLVYARGAEDNKGQCFYSISAVIAALKVNKKLPINIKILIEGSEEIGSPGLYEVLPSIGDKIKADHLLVVDNGFDSMERPSVTLGVRGIVALGFEITGSSTDLHSGIHGGIAYNANHALVDILSKLRDASGKVLVPGFYQGVEEPTADELALYDLTFNEKSYFEECAAKPTGGEKGFAPLIRNWFRPTLEINGLGGGYQGPGSKTVIPAKALCKISCRLVQGQDPQFILGAVKSYLQSLVPEGFNLEFEPRTEAVSATRANYKAKISQVCSRAFSEINQKKCNFILSGASIPVSGKLAEVSGAEVVFCGYALPGDKIHAPNENFGLDRFEKGFHTILRIIELLAE